MANLSNIAAEEAVIGSLLLGETVNGLNLEAPDFFHEGNAMIYSACLSLSGKNVSINQITLAQELSDRKQLEQSGGAANLSHLMAICETPFDIKHYAEIVKRLSVYRGLINASFLIGELGKQQGDDVEAVLNQADDILLSLRKKGVSSPIVGPSQRAELMCQRYDALLTASNGVALPTGLRDLDYQIGGGLYAGELAILAARPGMGKTTLLMQIANHVAREKVVLVCSGEMTIDGITDRDVASALGISINQVRKGGYDDETYARITGEGLEPIQKRKLYFYHDSPMTTSKILQAGVNVQSRHGLDLVVIDYLGLLDDEKGSSQYERLGYISRKLKQMAMTLNVPLLVAHQLNRSLELRQDKRPELHDLRDSGRIEEDADLVLFIYRESYYKDTDDNITEINIAKQRQGDGHRSVQTYYDHAHQLYRDLAK
jgi:replicative DNA helicase